MQKRRFLAPLAASLAALLGTTAVQANALNIDAERVSSVKSQVSSSVAPITDEDFVIHRNTEAATDSAYHRSHYSHRSHSSHRSHYSSYR